MKKIWFAVFLLAGVLLLTSCTGSEGAQGPQGPAGPTGAQGPAGLGLEPMTRAFDIVLGGGEIIGEHEEEEIIGEHEDEEEALIGEFHRWEPSVLMAFKGDTILLTVTNPHPSAHSFILPEFGVVTPLLEPQGGTAVVEFTVDEAGIFQFACGLPYDDEAGYCAPDHESMVGYLIVLER